MSTLSLPGAGVLNFHVKNVAASIYVSQLDPQTTESLLWELFIRCGPIHAISIHREKALGTHMGSATIEFKSVKDANYSTLIMNGIKLYGRVISVSKSQSSSSNSGSMGYVDPTTTTYDGLVTLHVGNLSNDVTEYDFTSIFSKFGPILRIQLMSDQSTGARLGYGFVTYNSFEAGDLAVARMNGQFLASRQISVQYGIKNNDTGERYGNQSDRLLLSKAEQNSVLILQQSNDNNRRVESHEEGNTGTIIGLQQQQQQQQPKHSNLSQQVQHDRVDLSSMCVQTTNPTIALPPPPPPPFNTMPVPQIPSSPSGNNDIDLAMIQSMMLMQQQMGLMHNNNNSNNTNSSTTTNNNMNMMMGCIPGTMPMMPLGNNNNNNNNVMGGQLPPPPPQNCQYLQNHPPNPGNNNNNNNNSFTQMIQSQQMGTIPPLPNQFGNNHMMMGSQFTSNTSSNNINRNNNPRGNHNSNR